MNFIKRSRIIRTLISKLVFTACWILTMMTHLNAQCTQDCTNFNTIVGGFAGSVTTGPNNAFFGYFAGNKNTTGFDNAFFGAFAGEKNISGQFNTFFGNGAGRNNTASSNSFFGRHAGEKNTSGTRNSVFGSTAGKQGTTANDNTFFGYAAGTNTTSPTNSFFGSSAGVNNTTGSANTYIGRSAGHSNVSGTDNTSVGYRSGYRAKGTGNVFLGHGAGPTVSQENADHRLYIDVIENTTTGHDEPLIYGEFDNDFVRINGTFEVTAGLSNPSSVVLKQDFRVVDKLEVLAKVASLSIQEWAYKKDPGIRHLGPTAEEFRNAFALGQDAKTISTIDADGVALIAIQALKEEVDTLKEKNDSLENLVSDLMERVLQLEEGK